MGIDTHSSATPLILKKFGLEEPRRCALCPQSGDELSSSRTNGRGESGQRGDQQRPLKNLQRGDKKS